MDWRRTAAIAAFSALPALAMANADLEKQIANSKNWAMQAGDMFNQRYSKLDQINKDNVGKMQVAWTFSTGVLRGHEGSPLVIGDDVLIGHMAMVHGCTLADRAFVGLKATVMNGCRIGSDAMLAAGALLTENKEIPDRELWAGSPARRVREIGDAQAAGMQMGVAHYVLNGRMHKAAIDG